MRSVMAIVQKAFLRNMSYRFEIWLRLIGNISVVFIQISIWSALLGTGAIEGIDLSTMITYSIISTSVSMILMYQMIHTIDGKLKNGDISMDLLKPISFPILMFFDQVGNICFQVLFTLVPTIVISSLLFGLTFPHEWTTLLLFFIAILFAVLISFFISYLIALISFWFLTTFALEWMFTALITVFSGSFLPLWFFSKEWRGVAEMLPFQFLGFIPAAIFMETIEGTEVLWVLVKGVLWIITLWIIVQLLWRRAIRRLVLQGG